MAEFIVIQFFQNSNIVFHEGKDHGAGAGRRGPGMRGGGGRRGGAGTPFKPVFNVFLKSAAMGL